MRTWHLPLPPVVWSRGGTPVPGQERVGREVRVDLWRAVGWVSARSQEWLRDAGRSAGATGADVAPAVAACGLEPAAVARY